MRKYWWPNNFYCGGAQFTTFWGEYLSKDKRRILFIMGKGFDDRMNMGIKEILKCSTTVEITCIAINFIEGDNSPSKIYEGKVQKNFQELEELLKGNVSQVNIEMLDNKRRTGGRKVAELFKDPKSIAGFSDIILDISAMPRSIYFPLINRLLKVCRIVPDGGQKTNLHIVIAENSSLDIRITASELDENASYMFSFGGQMELESLEELPIVWFPVLGEGKLEQLRIIHKLIKNSLRDLQVEIYPVLPFPAKDPRRVDDLIAEYHQILLEHFEVEPGNIIYADEQNPFDVYKQIRDAGDRYDEALEPLEGCRKVVSALSSKLLSLGVLIAAFEGNMAVGYVGAQGYNIAELNEGEDSDQPAVLFEVWLEGEPYCS